MHEDRDQTTAPLLIGVAEVGRITSLAPRTVWRHVSAGRLPRPLKVGGRRLWRREAIVRWIEAGCPAEARP